MFYVIAIVVFIAIVFGLQKLTQAGRVAAHNPEATAAANRMLFERTGFRHTALGADKPIEEHVEYSNQLALEYAKTSNMETDLIRNFQGFNQYHRQSMKMQGAGYSIAAFWHITHGGNPPAVFHIADKKIGTKVNDLATGYKRSFSPMYQEQLTINDPELAARFNAWGNSAEWLNHVLAVPEIKQNLLSHAEVDLVVTPEKISFADPTQANLRAAMGGTAGMMSAASNPMGIMETQIAYHDNMGFLLTSIAKTMNLNP